MIVARGSRTVAPRRYRGCLTIPGKRPPAADYRLLTVAHIHFAACPDFATAPSGGFENYKSFTRLRHLRGSAALPLSQRGETRVLFRMLLCLAVAGVLIQFVPFGRNHTNPAVIE